MNYRQVAATAVEILGDDRDGFLQGQCTNDIKRLGSGSTIPAACLTPKGKILFLFRVKKTADGLRLLLESDRAADLAAHLSRFAVFTKVAVDDLAGKLVRFDLYDSTADVDPPDFADVWPAYGEFRETWLVPRGRSAETERLLAARNEPIGIGESERRRILAGRPNWGSDFDETFLFDELDMPEAVSYTKGCYVGQEIVARVRTYGKVNRRLVRLEFAGEPVESGAVLLRPGDPGREMGRATSVSGHRGLGTVRREIADGDVVAVDGVENVSARVLPRAPE